MKKDRRMTVRLTQAHWGKLERLAGATGATPSDVMRVIVDRADDAQALNANSRGAQLSTVGATAVSQ